MEIGMRERVQIQGVVGPTFVHTLNGPKSRHSAVESQFRWNS